MTKRTHVNVLHYSNMSEKELHLLLTIKINICVHLGILELEYDL